MNSKNPELSTALVCKELALGTGYIIFWKGGPPIIKITVFAPTKTSTNEVNATFYNQLCHTIQRLPTSRKLAALDNFNDWIGKEPVCERESIATAVLKTVSQ